MNSTPQHISLALALLLAAAPASPQHTPVPDNSCPSPCTLRIAQRVQLDFGNDDYLLGLPRVVRGDRTGRVLVIQTKEALNQGPPLVFGPTGRLVGKLGGRGRGPGESEYPEWLAADFDDSLRIFESGRMVVFDEQLRHAHTTVLARSIERPMEVVSLSANEFVGLGTGGITPGTTRPLEVLRLRQGPWQPFPLIRSEEGSTGMRALGRARDLSTERVWIAQYSLSEGRGYDLYLADRRSGRVAAFRRRPSWWRTLTLGPAITSAGPPLVSRVAHVREIRPGVVAVLIAQPSDDTRRMRANPRTGAGGGWWNGFESLIEIIDTRTGRKLGELRVPGMPRGFVADDRVVSYYEEDDEPQLWMATFVVP